MVLNSVSKVFSFGLGLFILVIFGSALMKSDKSMMVLLVQDKNFGQAVLFSLETSCIAMLFSLFTAIPVGYYLARNKGRLPAILDALFDIPVAIPPLIVGVLLLSFFNLSLVKQFYCFIFTMPGAVIGQYFVAVPFTIRAAKSSFELVPAIYEDVAMTLGAKPARAFYDTTFKLALPGITAGMSLSWLRCLGEFGATLMVGGGISGQTANILIYIYLNLSSGEFDKGMAAAILVIMCVFVVIAAIRWLTGGRYRQTY